MQMPFSAFKGSVLFAYSPDSSPQQHNLGTGLRGTESLARAPASEAPSHWLELLTPRHGVTGPPVSEASGWRIPYSICLRGSGLESLPDTDGVLARHSLQRTATEGRRARAA